VKITPIPSAIPPSGNQYLTSHVINDSVAIDAGAIGYWQAPTEQAAIRHIFLSHTHIDHLASLPVFLENVASFHDTPVNVYASEIVQQSLREDLFNGRLWANFLDLKHERGPFVNLVTIASGQRIQVEGLSVTPVAVNHAVPTLGFIIEDGASAIIVASDTAPTQEIWERGNATPNLKAVFLEATFPDEMEPLAELSKHLTPASFVREMRKLTNAPTFFAVHLRARCKEQVTQQLLAHRLPNLRIAEFGKTYEF
jgi:ribonuclease BN (tRNA processing enzyme)